MEEPARFLHRHAAYGYTYAPSVALREEGSEALSEAEQEAMTRRSHRERAEREAREWKKTAALIVSALDHFREVGRPGVQTEHRLRALERETRAVARGLDG